MLTIFSAPLLHSIVITILAIILGFQSILFHRPMTFFAGEFVKNESLKSTNSKLSKVGKTIVVNAGDSIQTAINSANAGDTIKVNGGTYAERISIVSDQNGNKNNIKIIGKEENDSDDKRPKIILAEKAELVSIQADGIVFQGFEVSNGEFLKTGENNQGVTAIRVKDGSTNVTIADNYINTIGMNYETCHCYGNSHAINVKSYSSQKIENVQIIKNKISNMHLGRSEAITINGNVSNFSLEGNEITNIDNIGIDIGGFQENDKDGNPLNYQANGKILQNTLFTNAELFQQNPGQKSYWIAGIYIDGGKDVFISRNYVTSFGFGIVVASEKCEKSVDNIIVSNNLLAQNVINGISVGHGLEVDEKQKVENDQRSFANSVSLINNTIIVSDLKEDGGALRLVSHRIDGIKHLTIANNLIFAKNQEGLIKTENFIWRKDSKEIGCQKIGKKIKLNYRLENQKKLDGELSNNLFYNQLTKEEFDKFLAQITISTSKNNYFIDPVLNSNYSLGINSPACNKGNNSYYIDLEKSFDLLTQPRLINTTIDIGAFEYQRLCDQ
jgi:hypothetical protein